MDQSKTGGTAYKATVKEIRLRQKRAQEGHANCIPLPFARTSELWPGIERATYDIITASSGVAKSKYTRFVYVINSYMFVKNNPNADIRLKIFYFALEESKQKFMLSIISYYLWYKYKLRVSVKQLRSVKESLPEETMTKIEAAWEFFSDFEDYVEIIDDIHNPTGIFKTLKTYHEQRGEWTFREFSDPKTGNPRRVHDSYTPNDPNEYVMCITDHIGLLRTESGLSKWETIGRFSSEHCVELRNKYGTIVVNVQQQGAESEKKQFNFRGQSIAEKVEPTLDGLANNKETQRDADNVFGLFAPDRYQIDQCEDYDINLLQDYFRLCIILKSRDGHENVRTPLFFDGASNRFAELPRREDTTELTKMYEFVSKLT